MKREIIQLDDFLKEANEIENFVALCNDDDYGILEAIYWYLMDKESDVYIGDTYPFKFIESQEIHGDGEQPEVEYIFKRKSDGKHFALWSYKGKIQENDLREVFLVTKKKTQWE